MEEYIVEISESKTYEISVEAENESAARSLAKSNFSNLSDEEKNRLELLGQSVDVENSYLND